MFTNRGTRAVSCRRPGAAAVTVSLIVLWFAFSAGAVPDDNAASTANPVLVELFTSEGCSTCPPADALVQQMDSSQPVPGAQLIVLSEHVDYWDHDGWKDPHSSHALTERQISYVQALGLPEPYTPQVIVDGRKVLRGDADQIQRTLADEAASPKLAVRISSISAQGGELHAHVSAAGAGQRAQVFAALALDHADSQVLRGENGGKHLTHVAVVEELRKVGDIGKGKEFDQDVRLKLRPSDDPKNLRLVVFVQEPGPGKVLGAAMQRP